MEIMSTKATIAGTETYPPINSIGLKQSRHHHIATFCFPAFRKVMVINFVDLRIDNA
jgi:hypothetical protein